MDASRGLEDLNWCRRRRDRWRTRRGDSSCVRVLVCESPRRELRRRSRLAGGCARVRECSAVAEWVPALTPTPTFGPQRPLSELTQPTSPTHPSIAPHSSAEPTPTSSFFHPGRLRISDTRSGSPLLWFSLPYPRTCASVLCRFVSSRLGLLLYPQRALSARSRSRSPPLATESRIVYYYSIFSSLISFSAFLSFTLSTSWLSDRA